MKINQIFHISYVYEIKIIVNILNNYTITIDYFVIQINSPIR